MGSESHNDADSALYGDQNVASRLCLHYANGMTRQALLALILVPGMAHAVICKTVDSEGVVSYTNMPAATCPDPVKLPKYSTFESLPVPASATRSESEVEESANRARFERYESIKIIQPEAAGVVRSNEGNVSVSIALEPGLQVGHRVTLYVDGRAVPGSFDGSAIELSGIERGDHSIYATISDGGGKQLIKSDAVSFTLRQTGLFDGGAKVPRPPIAPPVVRPRPGG
jgi:hypothetical protein